MNPGIEYYRPFGQPASGWLRFDKNLAVSDAITVDVDTYVAGTDFQIGDGAAITAQNFAAAVNSDRNRYGVLPHGYHNETNPARKYFAIYYGNHVQIVATTPGTIGHAIVLLGVADKVVASGLSLANGVDNAVYVAAAPSALLTTLTWNDYVRTGTGLAITLAAATLKARSAFVYAPPANPVSVAFGPNSSCSTTLLPGGGWTLPGHDGTAFDLNSWYFNGAVGTTIVVTYAS